MIEDVQTRENSAARPDSMTRVLVTGEQTGGRFAVVELVEARETGPLRHLHTREDELIYVLEGRISVQSAGGEISCPAGSCVLLPSGDEHGHVVESDYARLLVIVAPAGFEDFYARQTMSAGHGHEHEIERLVTVAAHFGVEITGGIDVRHLGGA